MSEPATANGASIALVVPCYNEATRLDGAVFDAYLKQQSDVLIVFVNDGSTDDTAAVLDRLHEQNPKNAVALHCAKNGGKAEAVRLGLLRALDDGAKFIGYWDADLATPLEEVRRFRQVFEERSEVELVLGARIRLLGRDISRQALRHYLGRVFATGASLCLNLAVYDTQCGAKLLRVVPDTRAMLSEPFGSRWIFDVELLARHIIRRGNAHGLYEHALASWRDVGESKVKPRDFFRSIGDLLRIYRNYSLNQPMRPVVLLATNLFSVYALVGALGTVVHYSILIVGVELFHLPTTLAVVLGASAGALTNYVMNYHMIFTSTASHRQTLPRFALVAALAAGLSWYGAKLALKFNVNYLLAQLACTVLVLLLGFTLNRYWTFGATAKKAG
jgi:dolichyl-phosphate beta-glucosyltransferase